MHNPLLERINLHRLHAAKKTEALFKRITVAIVCLPLLAVFIIHGEIIAFTVLIIIAAVLGTKELCDMALKKSSQNLRGAVLTLLGFLCISWFLSHLIMLRKLSPYFVISVLFITWAGDAAAYFFGSFYGKHKLIPRISPRKTVEGAFGAIACSLIAVFFVNSVFLEGLISLTVANCVVLGVVLGTAGIFGDIMESVIKRKFHRKNSGSLVPGHGGILDVIDSLLFTAPAMYYYLKIFKLL